MRREPGRSTSQQYADSGFTLVIVLWGLALISLLCLAVIAMTRNRVIVSESIVEGRKAEALAEAGVNLVRFVLQLGRANEGGRRRANGEPSFCTMPDGSLAALALEDEGGKVDLNASAAKLIATVLQGLGADAAEADVTAKAIFDFTRTPGNEIAISEAAQRYASAGRSYRPKRAPFESTLELDQVLELRHELFRKLLPLVTIYSRNPGIDLKVAPPGLLAALSGDGTANYANSNSIAQPSGLNIGIPAELQAASAGRVHLIHAEVRTPAGGYFSQEAIVERSAGQTPDTIREWRRGDDRFRLRLEEEVKMGRIHSPC